MQEEARARPLLAPGAPPPPSRLHPSASSGRTLLDDFLTAAAHSKAAYGYPAAAGHLDSMRSYIQLCTLERLRWAAGWLAAGLARLRWKRVVLRA